MNKNKVIIFFAMIGITLIALATAILISINLRPPEQCCTSNTHAVPAWIAEP